MDKITSFDIRLYFLTLTFNSHFDFHFFQIDLSGGYDIIKIEHMFDMFRFKIIG